MKFNKGVKVMNVKNQYLISIIVPVYNAEKFISRCIESLLNQTYQNFEILLINDGSTDKSLEICEEYLKKDNRIKLFSQDNGGLSSARNLGLKFSSGDFLSFIDSDDFIFPEMMEDLIKICLDYDCDIAKCSLIQTGEKFPDVTFNNDVQLYTQKEIMKSFQIIEDKFQSLIPLKLYSKRLFMDIKFKEGIIHEDEEILFKILFKSNLIGITTNAYYCYYFNPTSIMRSSFNLNKLDIIPIYEERLKLLQEKDQNDLLLEVHMKFSIILSNLYVSLSGSSIETKKENLKKIKRLYFINEKTIKEKYSQNNPFFTLANWKFNFPIIFFLQDELKKRVKKAINYKNLYR